MWETSIYGVINSVKCALKFKFFFLYKDVLLLLLSLQYYESFYREFNTWCSQCHSKMHLWFLWRLLTMILLSSLFPSFF